MTVPKDRVQVLKRESVGGGGDAADDNEWGPAQLNENEDALSAQGYFVQRPEPSEVKDKEVYITRNAGDDMLLRDPNANAGAELTLSDLLAGGVIEPDWGVHFFFDGS